MNKVYEAEIVEAAAEEALPEPKAESQRLVQTCSGCGKESKFALGVIMGKPYCGSCILTMGRQLRDVIRAVLGPSPRIKKDSK